ncbi:MAG: aminotransferase class III-fold pyridoxal phosphate-dependent enzyme [Candidatus Brocadia sp.]|jgi:glutamate-1-semialdehyde 2,1-aminomutase
MKQNYFERYRLSQQLHEKASKVIPLGSQTFSKSKTQYPYGVSPYFIKRGNGSHVWDADNNEYIDFVNALAAITLGYNDPDVTKAVKEQLEYGTIFSLPHELELKVAEKIVEMVPCAEMVRFGKNGSDVTAGAIRLARAYTKRDHIAVCGYHGWQDWYIGSTSRNQGVPKATQDLTHTFNYNDIHSLQKIFQQWPDQVAAVIMEAMNVKEPEDNFLEKCKDLAHKNGALFILDEIITGFRYANGGAQEYFGVIPDLATFGKGLANGYPVSAIAGRADIMKFMEEIFFSFTFGGETLSLAAAFATLVKLQREPVIDTLWRQGRKIVEGTKALIEKHDLKDVLSVGGKECWSFLSFKDTDAYSQWELKTLFLQEVFARGILTIGSHNMAYAHSDDDIARLLEVYNEVFGIIKEVIAENNLNKRLRTKPLIPLFKIR